MSTRRSRFPESCILFSTLMLQFTALVAAQTLGDIVPDFKWEKLSIICTNMATGVECDTNIAAINFGGLSSTHRNIISVDVDGLYALGFHQIAPGEFYLSIYPFYPSDNSAGPTIWTANRGDPVDENGTLGFLSTGSLELRDSRGTVKWCTWSQNKGVEQFVFSPEFGMIELLNQANQSLWSSFNESSDTLVQNQVLSKRGAVVSSRTADGRGQGRYSMVMEAGGLVLYTGNGNDNQSEPYRVYALNGIDTLHSVLHTCKYLTSASFFLPSSRYAATLEQNNSTLLAPRTDLDSELCRGGSANDGQIVARGLFDLENLGSSGTSRVVDKDYVEVIKLEHNGTLSVQTWRKRAQRPKASKVIDLLGSDDPCRFPDMCGPYGVCTSETNSSYSCSCPLTAGDRISSDWNPISTEHPSLGCTLLKEIVTCADEDIRLRAQFIPVPNADYFANEFSTPFVITEDACKKQCLQDCSCVAAFYKSTVGHCFPVYQPLHSLRQANGSFNAYIKVKGSDAPLATSPLFLIFGSAVAALLVTLTLASVCIWKRRKRKFCTTKFFHLEDDLFLDTLSGLPPRLPLKVLEKATQGFIDKLGEGGFGAVYNGVLPDGSKVAVKRLEGPGQGAKEFRAEVATIGSIHHKNLVQLCGFCVEGAERLLVYEHMANGSLDSLLFPDRLDSNSINVTKNNDNRASSLAWGTRMSVAKDTARGLAYLHEGCREKIIHLDIKPQNILLGDHFQAKVADFGLSTLVKRDKHSLVVTRMRGTPGYLAPEWLHMAAVTEKADVYSYGMVLLELVSGRRIVEPEKVYLPAWAFQKIRTGHIEEVIDLRLDGSVDMDEAKRMIRVAFLCIQEDPLKRPSMSMVVQMLEGRVTIPESPRVCQLQRILSMSTICLSDQSSGSASPPVSDTDDSNRLGHSFNGLGQRATNRGNSYLLEGGLSTAYNHSVTTPR